MGKISSGCDILFVIKGLQEEAIPMGTTLSSGLTSFLSIVQELEKLPHIREQLRDLLKYSKNNREITREDLEREGLVHNMTVESLSKKYTDFDWSGIDLSTKVFATNWFRYYGQDLSNKIIKQHGSGGISTIYVVDPDNPGKVEELYTYLKVQSKLKQLSDETREIIDSFNIAEIIPLLTTIAETLKKKADKYEKLYQEYKDLSAVVEDLPEGSEERKVKERLVKLLLNRLAKLEDSSKKYKHLSSLKVNSAKDLLLDFMENKSLYTNLTYSVADGALSVFTILENTLRVLEGKKARESVYLDVFANEIAGTAKYIFSRDLSSMSKASLINALNVKLADLRAKRTSLSPISLEYNENTELCKKIDSFLKREIKKNEHWTDIINTLIESSDDEFSYSIADMTAYTVYFKDVPRTLENKYPDLTKDTIALFKPVGTHMGFTIYQSPDGKEFYFSRHVITTKSYGKRYKSPDECRIAINTSILSNPINLLSLIEFKTRNGRNVVFLPNRFLVGLVIKSLNMRFNSNLILNSDELKLIYDTGSKNSNTLDRFYKYVMDVVDTRTPEYTLKLLTRIVDTAEKAACFIYALNELEGPNRDKKIKSESLKTVLDRIEKAEYEYFVVEEVGGRTQSLDGFKKYYKTEYDSQQNTEITTPKGVFKTVLTEVKSADFNDRGLLLYDETTSRPISSIRVLNELSDKIKNKLGITVHIETLSTLEDMFKEWKEKGEIEGDMPTEVKGFVKNGEIYINASNAGENDLFHEFTHIMLGVLKAKNYDNYVKLVDIVANHKKSKWIRKLMKNTYKHLAKLDLDEEVFAELFGLYLLGRDFGIFLNGMLKDARKAVDKNMGSIFGAEEITEDFYHAKPYDVLRLFGYDLGLFILEGNGLEFSVGKNFRQASAWIESQIRKYEETGNTIGIYEDC